MKSRKLRWLGMFVLDTTAAVFGTAIFESALYRAIPVHTILAILWKIWCLDITCATLIGFLMYRTWKSNSTKWVWVLPMLWFCLGVLVRGFRHSGNILYQDSAVGYFLTQFSGVDCKNGSRSPGCLNFFLFSIPLVRAIFYSIGGIVSSRIYTEPPGLETLAEASGPTALGRIR
jgi:hypothetical protein